MSAGPSWASQCASDQDDWEEAGAAVRSSERASARAGASSGTGVRIRGTRAGAVARGAGIRRSTRLGFGGSARASSTLRPTPPASPAMSHSSPQGQQRASSLAELACLQPYKDVHDTWAGLADAQAKAAYLNRQPQPQMPQLDKVATAPSDLATFSRVIELVQQLVDGLAMCRLVGPNEDMAISHAQACFTDAALPHFRTALLNVPDDRQPRLHAALTAVLQAYLPPRAAKLWRDQLAEFVWPASFPLAWAELDRLWRQRGEIAVLSASFVEYQRLSVGTPGEFLQVLEDKGPAWVGRALERVEHGDTLHDVRGLLGAANPDPSGSGSALCALRAQVCYYCCQPGHLISNCPRRLAGLPAINPSDPEPSSTPYTRPTGASFVTGVHALPQQSPASTWPGDPSYDSWARHQWDNATLRAHERTIRAQAQTIEGLAADLQALGQPLPSAAEIRAWNEWANAPTGTPVALPDGPPPATLPHEAAPTRSDDNQAWADSLPENALSSFRSRARPASRKDGAP